MLTKDRGGVLIIERRAEPHRAGDVADDAPVRPRLARRRKEGALAADPAFRIRHRSRFFSPPGGGQQHVGQFRRVSVGEHVRYRDEGRRADCVTHGVGLRHRNRRVGGHDPEGLDLSPRAGAEQIDRLQAGFRGDRWRAPVRPNRLTMRRILQRQMAGEHVGQAADLPPAHRVRLPGDRKRPHAGPPDAPCGEVAIDDRIHLVHAGGRLVHALREDRHDLFGRYPKVEKRRKIGRRQFGRRHVVRQRRRKRVGQTIDMLRKIPCVERAAPLDLGKQAVK